MDALRTKKSMYSPPVPPLSRRRAATILWPVILLVLAACSAPATESDSPESVPGVTPTEIVIGSSLPLKGHASLLGARTLSGAMACINDVNDRGGVFGRKIKVITYDDGYDPPRCLANTQQLLVQDRVFALFCYVGTPTTVRILPMVEDAKIPLVGMFTGANALRRPFNPWLVNIRASYYQETGDAVRHMVEDLGLTRIAIFYQYDAYGFDGLTGTELALKKYGLKAVARGSYVRGTTDVWDGLERIRKSQAQAVVMIGTYAPCAQLIRQAVSRDITPLFYSVSFTGARALANLLPRDPRIVLVMSQAVPSPDKSNSATDYVRLLKRYFPDKKPSFTGLEGYVNARVLVEGLKKAGKDLTRKGFIRAVESIRDYKVGPDIALSYGPGGPSGNGFGLFHPVQGRRIRAHQELGRGQGDAGPAECNQERRIMNLLKVFSRLSLKNKIVVSFLGVMLAVSLVIAFLTRGILIASLTTELEERGLGVAWSVAERGGSFILDRNTPELLSLIYHEATSGKRKALIKYIYVQSRDGKILSHTFIKPLPKSLIVAHSLPADKETSVKRITLDNEPILDIAVPVNEGLHRLGAVHVGVRQRRIHALVDKLRMTFMAYISVIIVVVWVVSDRISRYITRPVSRLTRISDELSKGDFDIPINITGREDGETERDCPAFSNSEIFCRRFQDTFLSGKRDAGTSAPANTLCETCVFDADPGEDEVGQLASSFQNMVWSIKLYRKKLRESEEKYRSLFDSGPEPLVVMDAQTLEILDANPRAVELYGFAREEILGRSFSELDRDGNIDPNSPALSGKHGLPSSVYVSKVIQFAKGGNPFYANICASPIVYGDRNAVVVSVADVTEMMEMDAQLIQASKMKSLGEMSAGIAHEVNQPLNAIKMGSEYLLLISEQQDLNVGREDYREAVAEISAQVDRAAEIIQTLRSFGRKADLGRSPVDVNDTVRSVLTMVRKQMELDGIDFRMELNPDLPKILAQDNRLQQVFFNLLTNARDAILEKGDGQRRVTVRTGLHEDQVVVDVEDSGGGIPEANRDKIFEPFFTTKKTGQGMGLGLSIIYGMVQDNGGEIQVARSGPDGTVFRVSFPRA